MNERPTPETDAAEYLISIGRKNDQWVVRSDVSRKLERERDEAREQVKELIYISERAIALADIDLENDKFGVVSELRDGLTKIKESK